MPVKGREKDESSFLNAFFFFPPQCSDQMNVTCQNEQEVSTDNLSYTENTPTSY